MTLLLPLEASAPVPTHPSFVLKPSDTQNQLEKVFKTILKAKRIVVICGAGISVHAGIPDFRSPEGLFQTLKRDNPKEALASGKDLFDASVFKSETMTSLFCQMISHLSDLSKTAEPTPFHKLLHTLDTTGRLLRVYTQNIDAIEEKCGLTFGVPEFESKRNKSRAKGKETPKETNFMNPMPTPPEESPIPAATSDLGPSSSRVSTPSTLASSSSTTPRCIPLHGTLQMLHCQVCKHSFPLSSHLSSLASGIPPDCPECISMETTRQLIGKRARGIGKLRPSVVLYNEEHKDGEGVGEIVSRDLMGSKGKVGADLLLVVGTSLKVPGTKRMVREFAKAVHSRGSGAKETEKEKEKGKEKGKDQDGSKSTSASPGPSKEENATSQSSQQSLKALYLNLDFPVPTREWEGVFDAWIQGDAQTFAEMLRDEIEKDARAKEVAREIADERRRKRELKGKEQEVAIASLVEGQSEDAGQTPTKTKSKSKKKKGVYDEGSVKKRKNEKAMTVPSYHTPIKKRKVMVVISTPKSLMKYKRMHIEVDASQQSRKRTPPLLTTSPVPFDTRSLPSPHSPGSPSYEFRQTYPDLPIDVDHRLPTHSPTSKDGSHQHSYPHSPSIPRTPISKQHPSRLNWTLPTPEQSPALHNIHVHSHLSLQTPKRSSIHENHSQPSHKYHSPYDPHAQPSSFGTRSQSRFPSHYSHSHSNHPEQYTQARDTSSLSPPSSPWIPHTPQSHPCSRVPSGQTSRSSSSISSPIESVSEESSETETDVDSDATTEEDGVGSYFDARAPKVTPPPTRHMIPKHCSTSGYGYYHNHALSNMDTDDEIDIEGISDDELSSPVDDLRTRLGMSCVRTTQVAGGG